MRLNIKMRTPSIKSSYVVGLNSLGPTITIGLYLVSIKMSFSLMSI